MATGAPGAYVGTGSDVGTARPHGVDGRQITSGGDRHTKSFEPYFGENPKPYMLSPYDAYGRENFALPEAYLGYSPYMTNVMINLIKSEDMWPTTVLPYRETKDTSTIKWDEIHFNRHFLGPVPEEGVSRLVSQEMNERRDHYTRYGLAMILEHGFMNTDKGRMCYVNNLQQIRNAVLETIYMGVLEAFLRCKKYDEVWNERFGGVRSVAAARKAMAMEVEDWATIQKTEHGWDLLDSRCKRFLRSKNVSPDTWIIPEGLKPYISQVRRENYTYMLAGPEGPQNFKSGLNGQPANVVDSRNDCTIYESKSFELPDMSEPVDVMRRNRAIGEFYVMCEDMESLAHSNRNYTSAQRSIAIYDEDVDNFTEIRLEDAFKSDALFGHTNDEMISEAYKHIKPKEFKGDDDEYTNPNIPSYELTFGDIPESCVSGPPLSDRTINLFADSFFCLEDRQTYNEDFSKNMPTYLRDMTTTAEYDICTDHFETHLKNLFKFVRDIVNSCADMSDNALLECFCKEVRTLFAKDKDTYAFWMYCHSVAAATVDHTDAGVKEIMRVYREMYLKTINSRNIENTFTYPQPPEMTVPCFQQTVCAVFVVIMRVACTHKGFLDTFKNLEDQVERTSGELCGLWFDASDSTTTKTSCYSPTVELFHDVTKDRLLSSSNNPDANVCYVSKYDPPNLTFRMAMFITRAMFQYMSVNQTIRRGDSCKCVPVGYNTYHGVKYLSDTSNQRYYDQESCARIVQSYEHLRERTTIFFENTGLHKEPEDLFNIAIMGHRKAGNIYVSTCVAVPDPPLPPKFIYTTFEKLRTYYDKINISESSVNAFMDPNIEYQISGVQNSKSSTLNRLLTKLKSSKLDGGNVEERWSSFSDISGTTVAPEIAYIRDMIYAYPHDSAELITCFKLYLADVTLDMSYDDFIRGNDELRRKAMLLDMLTAAAFMLFFAATSACDNRTCLQTSYNELKRKYEEYADGVPSHELLRIISNCQQTNSVRVCFENEKRPLAVDLTAVTTPVRKDAVVSLFGGLYNIRLEMKDDKNYDEVQILTVPLVLCTADDSPIRTVFKAPAKIKSNLIFSQQDVDRIAPSEDYQFVQYLNQERGDRPNKQCDELYDNLKKDRMSSGPPSGSLASSSSSAPSINHYNYTTTESRDMRVRVALNNMRNHTLIVHLLFCHTKIKYDFLCKLIKHDVMFPFGYLVLRPYQTYEMCTAVLTKSGKETGETLIGHYDFQLSDNVVQKMHYGNFTIYEKSIIYRPMNVHLAEDIFCANYLGGAGSKFYKNEMKEEEDHFYDRMTSLYACAIGYDEMIKDNPISINGRFEDFTGLRSINEPHYSTSEFYKRQYNFAEQPPPSGDMPYFETASRGNTVCFQGHQASYNHASGYLDRVVLNTGHWGERVYPGCGKVRRGLSKYLEPVNYSTMRRGGGGPVNSTFGI